MPRKTKYSIRRKKLNNTKRKRYARGLVQLSNSSIPVQSRHMHLPEPRGHMHLPHQHIGFVPDPEYEAPIYSRHSHSPSGVPPPLPPSPHPSARPRDCLRHQHRCPDPRSVTTRRHSHSPDKHRAKSL
jgi:hypothetical protein